MQDTSVASAASAKANEDQISRAEMRTKLQAIFDDPQTSMNTLMRILRSAETEATDYFNTAKGLADLEQIHKTHSNRHQIGRIH